MGTPEKELARIQQEAADTATANVGGRLCVVDTTVAGYICKQHAAEVGMPTAEDADV